MSFLKSLAARFGEGAAKIDLVLDQTTAHMGSEVTGKIIVTGGNVEQQIDDIEVELRVSSAYWVDDVRKPVDHAVARVKAVNHFSINPGETKTFPFRFVVPMEIPFSTSIVTKYYFKTSLDISYAVDAVDKDDIFIKPSGLLKNFIDGMDLLGCKISRDGYTGQRQLLGFRQTSWMRGKLDELEFYYETGKTNSKLTGFFEVDKKTFGAQGRMMDKLDLDEKKGKFTFTEEQLATPQKAADTIRQFVEGIYVTLKG